MYCRHCKRMIIGYQVWLLLYGKYILPSYISNF